MSFIKIAGEIGYVGNAAERDPKEWSIDIDPASLENNIKQVEVSLENVLLATSNSDSDDDVMIVDGPAGCSNASTPQHEIIFISSSPDHAPPLGRPNLCTSPHKSTGKQLLPRFPEISISGVGTFADPLVIDPHTPPVRHVPDSSFAPSSRVQEWPPFPFPEPTHKQQQSISNLSIHARMQPLPPALRPSQVSVLGQYLLEAHIESSVVKTITLHEFKNAGWKFEGQKDEFARASVLAKNHDTHDYIEHAQDWRPPLDKEEATKRNVSLIPTLLPPHLKIYELTRNSSEYPPRQSRKRLAQPRDPAVKIEEREWALKQ
ncbi:hypothetical protein RhiLY_01872 [Ceratobasidium sp. AG-Ba]|nr:hypothetical protein RhiLY_01872 [Ceratobasidium sp. AG-Ba]